MARLLRRGTLLLRPGAAVSAAVRSAGRAHVSQQHHRAKLRYLEQADLSEVEVGLFGSSHVFWGINPHAFPQSAYNFGDMGDCLFQCRQKFLRYAIRMPKLKVVSSGIDEFMFGAGQHDANAPDYLRFGFPLFQSSAATTLQAWLPIVRYRHDVIPQFLGLLSGHSVLPVTPTEDADVPSDPTRMTLLLKSGFLFKPQQMNVSRDFARERAALRYAGYDGAFRAANRQALHDLLANATSRHLQVVLVTTPVLPAYREVCNRQMLAEHAEDIQTALSDFPAARRISYWNEDFPTAEFEDPDHLNRVGAEHLGRRIAAQVADVRVGRP